MLSTRRDAEPGYEPPKLSATGIGDWRACKRKWGWPKLDGLKRGSNAAAELGTRVHSVLENWLKFGTEINVSTEEGRIAAAGIQYLPPPSDSHKIEEWIDLYTDVAVFVGKVDLEYQENGRVVVHDHKTTSDLGWAKEPDTLRRDPQALLYAAEAMSRHGIDEVDLQWLYMRTKGAAKAKPVRLTLVREEVVRGLEIGFEDLPSINATAKEMLDAHAAGLNALDLPPTVSACSAYGGCAYQDDCKLTALDVMKATMAQETMIEKMKRERAEKAAAEAKANGGAPSAATTPREPPKVNPPAPTGAKPAAAPAAAPPPAGLDFSPLVAAIREHLGKRDLRDEIVLALISSGKFDIEELESVYEIADAILAKRGK